MIRPNIIRYLYLRPTSLFTFSPTSYKDMKNYCDHEINIFCVYGGNNFQFFYLQGGFN